MTLPDLEISALRMFVEAIVEHERAKIEPAFTRLLADTYTDTYTELAANLILHGQLMPPSLSPQTAAQVWAQAQSPAAAADYQLSVRL